MDSSWINSPFTKALAAKIVTPGLAIEEAFKQVRVQVLADTGGKQTPWDTSSLTGAFTFVAEDGAKDEESLWAEVSKSTDPVQIMLFLRAYPQSKHEKDAKALLAAAMQTAVGAGDSTARAMPAGPGPDEVNADIAAAITGEAVTFAGQLTQGDAAIKGKTIESLVASTPLFTPIEGLPKEAWDGQPCAACHKWTKPALCDQAKFYVKENAPSAKLEQHPLGGDFKLTLKAWAAAGCK